MSKPEPSASPTLVVTDFDRRRLDGMLRILRGRPGACAPTLDALGQKLARARVVAAKQVPETVVTMNSRVCVVDPEHGVHTSLALTFPGSRDADDDSVSVSSPLGVALLGRSEGDLTEWQTGSGPRRLRVEAILYQPEAEGHYFA